MNKIINESNTIVTNESAFYVTRLVVLDYVPYDFSET